ncbi:MAG: ribosome-associated protein [Gammaproteobacteria bacterium]|jgi:ribosome-associated protein
MNSKRLCKLSRKAVDELKGQDIVELDVRKLTDVTDYLLIVTGRSARQVKAIAENVIEKAKEAGVRPLGAEGFEDADWVLVDLVDVVVHVMQPDARTYYELEKLWTPISPVKSGADSSAVAIP